jgi:hypothetical protein
MKESCLTVRWNNLFSIALGVVAAIYVITVLIAGVSTASFIGLIVIGGFG